MAAVRDLLYGAASLLLPASCAGCGNPLEEMQTSLCLPCRQALTASRTCGLGPGGASFDRLIAPFPYEGVAKTLIVSLKYNHRLSLVSFLSGILAETILECLGTDPADGIVPVPLHPTRRRERTFNQAEALARDLARRLDLPCRLDLLSRTKPTLSQTELTRSERRANLEEAFRIQADPLIRASRLLLVDDVFTTGATAESCARLLKEAGAASVAVVTVARG